MWGIFDFLWVYTLTPIAQLRENWKFYVDLKKANNGYDIDKRNYHLKKGWDAKLWVKFSENAVWIPVVKVERPECDNNVDFG